MKTSPNFSSDDEKIAQGFGFTRDIAKARNNRLYFQLSKIPCGFKEQARGRQSGEKFGLGYPFLASLLLLALTGCNDGGIVGTGTGNDADSPQLAGDAATAEIAADAAASFPASIEEQQQLCAALPLDLAGALAGATVDSAAKWQQEGDRAFSCRWMIQTETGATEVVIEINGEPGFGDELISNVDGKYSSASASVLNNGYEIIDDICTSGIVIPVDESLGVTVSRENREACASGTDRQPTIALLNRMGAAIVSLLERKP